MNFDNDTVESHGFDNTLSAGDKHNCTALDNGSVMCWGLTVTVKLAMELPLTA